MDRHCRHQRLVLENRTKGFRAFSENVGGFDKTRRGDNPKLAITHSCLLFAMGLTNRSAVLQSSGHYYTTFSMSSKFLLCRLYRSIYVLLTPKCL